LNEWCCLAGSRARGNARADSDYDVAIFLKDFNDRWGEVDRLVPLVTDILYDSGAFIQRCHTGRAHTESVRRSCTKSAAKVWIYDAGGGALPREGTPDP
jgi:hypothetical protein